MPCLKEEPGKKLAKQRRVQTVKLKQTMFSEEVSNTVKQVKQCFKHRELSSWTYLVAEGGGLQLAENQNPGGEIVDEREGLYIQEKDKEVTVLSYQVSFVTITTALAHMYLVASPTSRAQCPLHN